MWQHVHDVLNFTRADLFGKHREDSAGDLFGMNARIVREMLTEQGKKTLLVPLLDRCDSRGPVFVGKPPKEHGKLRRELDGFFH